MKNSNQFERQQKHLSDQQQVRLRWRRNLRPGDAVLVVESDCLHIGKVADKFKAENVMPNVKGREVLIIDIGGYAHAAFFVDTGWDIYSGSSYLRKLTGYMDSTETLGQFLATVKTAPQEAELWAASLSSDASVFLRFDVSQSPPDGWICIGAVSKIAKGQQDMSENVTSYHGLYDMQCLGTFLAGVIAADPNVVLWASDLDLNADIECCPSDSLLPGWVCIGDISRIVKSRDEWHGDWTGYGTCGTWADPDRDEDAVDPDWLMSYLSEVEKAMPKIDADMLDQTMQELRRLGWSATWGRLFLKARYGVVSPRLLSPEQLSDFLGFLRKSESSSQQELLASVLGLKKEQLEKYIDELPYTFDGYQRVADYAIAVGDLVDEDWDSDKVGIVCSKAVNLVTVCWIREPTKDYCCLTTPEDFSCTCFKEERLVRVINTINDIDKDFDLPNGFGLASDLRIKALALTCDDYGYHSSNDREIVVGDVVMRNKDEAIGIVRSLITPKSIEVTVLRKLQDSQYYSPCYENTTDLKDVWTKVDYTTRFDQQYIRGQLWVHLPFNLRPSQAFLDALFRIGSHVGLLTIPQLATGVTVENARLALNWIKRAGFFEDNKLARELGQEILASLGTNDET